MKSRLMTTLLLLCVVAGLPGCSKDIPVRSDVPGLTANAKFDKTGLKLTGYLVKACPPEQEHEAHVHIRFDSGGNDSLIKWVGNDFAETFEAEAKPVLISISDESCTPFLRGGPE